MLQTTNELLLHFFNSFSAYAIVEKTVFIFADGPIFFIPIFFIVLWIFYGLKKERKKQEQILLIFYSILIAILITLIIQHFIHLKRPEDYLIGAGKLLINHVPDASFPSDHATVSFAFLTALFFANYKKTFWIFLPFAIIMNISRIIAGVHWPFDIIAWMIIGIFWTIVIFRFVKETKAMKMVNSFLIKISQILKL
jgi:undecaprenyl-diphosphatase